MSNGCEAHFKRPENPEYLGVAKIEFLKCAAQVLREFVPPERLGEALTRLHNLKDLIFISN